MRDQGTRLVCWSIDRQQWQRFRRRPIGRLDRRQRRRRRHSIDCLSPCQGPSGARQWYSNCLCKLGRPPLTTSSADTPPPPPSYYSINLIFTTPPPEYANQLPPELSISNHVALSITNEKNRAKLKHGQTKELVKSAIETNRSQSIIVIDRYSLEIDTKTSQVNKSEEDMFFFLFTVVVVVGGGAVACPAAVTPATSTSRKKKQYNKKKILGAQ